jgi:DNA-binding NarL/FixJ family response regulator
LVGDTIDCPAAIACGDLPAPFVERLHAAVNLPGVALSLLRAAPSAHGLVNTVARAQPQFVLVPEAWLRHETLALLDSLTAAYQPACIFMVGSELSDLTLAHALRRGLRGIVEPDCQPAQLRRAFEAVRLGELWISRGKIIKALNLLTRPDPQDAEDTWRNLPSLTEREHSILRQILDGKSNKQIARDLGLSESTVKIHLQHIYQKLGVHRRLDLLMAKA